MAGKKIILFDIDGTLVTKNKAFTGERYTIKEKTINNALNEFFRCSDIDFTKSISEGLTDWIISERAVGEILNQKKISKSEWEKICQSASNHFNKLNKNTINANYYKLLPGVLDLLHCLNSKGVETGILTGNIKCFAKYKLFETGLLSFFDFGGYGENGKSRTEIIQYLLAKINNNKSIFIIGDTIHDGLAAKECGINFIGVGTSGLEKNQLADSLKSDAVHWVQNLTNKSVNNWIFEE